MRSIDLQNIQGFITAVKPFALGALIRVLGGSHMLSLDQPSHGPANVPIGSPTVNIGVLAMLPLIGSARLTVIRKNHQLLLSYFTRRRALHIH